MTTKTDAELAKLLVDTREVLRTERFSAAGARAKESNAPSKHRKTIARILTEQSARSTGSTNSPQANLRQAAAA